MYVAFIMSSDQLTIITLNSFRRMVPLLSPAIKHWLRSEQAISSIMRDNGRVQPTNLIGLF